MPDNTHNAHTQASTVLVKCHGDSEYTIPPVTMNSPWRWEMLLISLWIQVGAVPGIHCRDGTVNHLSREDILLLKDEQDPKCFTRTEEDFTCFFETADNNTYDLLYSPPEKRREMSVQRGEDGTFLHIYSFPERDVLLFVGMHLEVVEHNTNTSIYSRTVSVEDHLLVDPPFSVSLHHNGRAGQLQVSWQTNVMKYWKDYMRSMVRYFSKGLGEKTKEAKTGDILDSLAPGEEVEVQVKIKCAFNSDAGHWSRWSAPVRAVVPQSADDTSLTCYTTDLQNITCRWNRSRYGEENEYKLFYKMGLSEALGWTEWTKCLADRDLTELCRFRGDESRKIRVKLSSSSAPINRTFYTQDFTLNKSIKTSPPYHLRGALQKDRLCLKWEAPLLSLSAHLQYEVGYQIKESEAWMTVSLKGPETSACLEVPTGSQYSVKLRAKPNGSIYSGYWSDWSDVVTGDTPTDIGILLALVCIPVSMLIIALIFISMFSTYFSKLKHYFWPPVPDLDKVLQSFLTDINEPKWNPPITAKQCPEETTSSVVEIMSEDEVSELGKPSEESTQLLSPESLGIEIFPDYVTLNKDSVILCPNGNKYVYEDIGEKDALGARDELFQTCHCPSTDGSASLGSEFLNSSYLPQAEPADSFDCKFTSVRGPGNLYTNLPCS
ncbi:thrombopoietin receptor isoform X2 [Plectropomus leopardus]|uniref:thrombopoietin receptor isoform X2 n=1 Tax=Plectropomus leopardus TaxID=160734 RepID=UPI001C4C5E1D|nr:thrombopoietin receptor isoform X2 [Plectropomus leopardus]